MYQLGRTQELVIKRLTSIGAFLGEEGQENTDEDVLLPRKYLKKDKEVGDKIQVFIYKDNENRPIATTKRPKLELGEIGLLQVVDTTKIGAFLDWGLDKDLLLPFDEQYGQIRKFNYYLVGVYLDKSGRFTATMDVEDFFDKDVHYSENDWVDGVIYSYDSKFGAYVLIDKKYNGLLPQIEIDGIPKVGDKVHLRIKSIKQDGKIDLTYNNRAHVELNKDAEFIYKTIKDNGGFLRVNDKSDPKLIRAVFKMSKGQFKKSIGRLYKQRRIIFADGGVKII